MTKRGFKATLPPAELPNTQSTGAIKPLSSWQILQQSPKTFWQNFVPSAIVVLFPLLLIQLGTLMVNGFDPINAWTVPGLLIELLGGTLLLLNLAVSPYMQARSLRGEQPGIIDMYRNGLRFWLRIVGFGMLFSLLFVGGAILLIVPGLKVLRRYIMTPYFIIDDNSGIRQAMQRSAAASELMKRSVWSTIGLLLAVSAVGYSASKLPSPWGQLVSLGLSVACFYVLALRYQDARRIAGFGLVSASVRR